MVSHANLFANLDLFQERFTYTPEDTIVSWLPLHHDMGLSMGALQPVFAGIPCVLMSPVGFLQRPGRWLQALSEYRGTSCAAPNFAYELCANKLTPSQRRSPPATLGVCQGRGDFWQSERLRPPPGGLPETRQRGCPRPPA